MFPPPDKKKPAGPGAPPAGPPDPFGGAAPAPPAGPPGMPPMGGMAMPPMPPMGGMVKPGQGMDPMAAMLQGLGPDPMGGMAPPPQQGPPLGPGGMPFGGSLPGADPDGDSDMGGSDLLKALSGSLAGPPPGDPYGVAPMQPGQGFQGMGTGDPNMGIEQLLQALALGRMGVGGGPGGSGMDPGSMMGMGQMAGY